MLYISLNPLLSEVHGGGQAVLLLRETPSLTTWVELFGHQRVRANKRYKTYVANRIANIISLVPPDAWRHVPTAENPADCASRGLTPSELKAHDLWWTGPSWLHHQPVRIPKQPGQSELSSLQDLESKPMVCNALVASPATWLEHRYSSLRTLTHVVAWVKRFAHNFLATVKGHSPIRGNKLTVEEVESAELFLQRSSQARAFSSELKHLRASPPKSIPSTSNLLVLHPYLGLDGLLHVGGRLSKAPLTPSQKHPVIISSRDHFTKLLLNYYHVKLGHCGPTLLISHAGDTYHIVGARRLARDVCRQCMVCRKAAARVETQLMGQLPPARTTPAPPFTTTGLDYAGPFIIKYGYTRKPVLVKAYLAIFICFCTKAVHLEVVSDLTTEAFLAALKRFISRRGLPKHLHSDNGSNFMGARNDLQALYSHLEAQETQNVVHSFLLNQKIAWHTIPERAPHFGGLWEAAVKSAKHHLKRVVGQQKLTFEEFTTISAQVEAWASGSLHQP